MVQFEVWDKIHNRTIRRTTLKFEEAMDTLKVIQSSGNLNIVIYNRNDIHIKTDEKCNCNYHFIVTNNQLKKLEGLLTELNGGEKPEGVRY